VGQPDERGRHNSFRSLSFIRFILSFLMGLINSWTDQWSFGQASGAFSRRVLPERVFLEFSLRICYFKRKSLILSSEREQLVEGKFLLTIHSHKSIFQLSFVATTTYTEQLNPQPSGGCDENDFPEGAPTRPRGNFYLGDGSYTTPKPRFAQQLVPPFLL